MRLRRKTTGLVGRLRPYVDGGPPPEPMVSADPIRMFLYRWMIETGDPIEVVARGFDLDVREVWEIVSGDRRLMPGVDARRICALLELDVDDARPGLPGSGTGAPHENQNLRLGA